MGNANSRSLDPDLWLEKEHARIATRRRWAHGTSHLDSQQPENLTGLSLSGGGIRSALFNDGFLQGLSHRGVLRFVDYLCSVSGGGYIAGNLISQRHEKHGEDSDNEGADQEPAIGQDQTKFHDDASRWTLGRHPKTGQVNDRRLAGIGGYLSRPFEFIPAYLWSFFFSFAFYFGAVGIVTTLAALFWRSFDGELFRSLYVNVLGLHVFGDELLIAFIPALALIGLTIAGEAILFFYRLRVTYDEPKARRLHQRMRAVLLLALVFSVLTSLAIFVGNGKSFVGNQDGTLYLNKYAQLFAIAAAITQVLVFLGRERLFRSERGEAKSWQRLLHQSVTSLVIVILVFAMVHWIGRENISQYVESRNPQLVPGDVRDWNMLRSVIVHYEPNSIPHLAGRDTDSTNKDKLNEPTLDVDPPPHILPANNWERRLAIDRVWMMDWIRPNDISFPPLELHSPISDSHEQTTARGTVTSAPAKTFGDLQSMRSDLAWSLNNGWSLRRRIQGAAFAYLIQQFEPFLINSENLGSIKKVQQDDWTWTAMIQSAKNHRLLQRNRVEFLWKANHYLDRRGFTQFLVDNIYARQR